MKFKIIGHFGLKLSKWPSKTRKPSVGRSFYSPSGFNKWNWRVKKVKTERLWNQKNERSHWRRSFSYKRPQIVSTLCGDLIMSQILAQKTLRFNNNHFDNFKPKDHSLSPMTMNFDITDAHLLLKSQFRFNIYKIEYFW